MIDRVLSWRAAARDRDSFSFVTGSIRPVVDETVARFLRMTQPDEVQMRCRFAGARPVRHDPGALGQAILNLLVNAYKYSSSPRLISLEVRDEGPNVRVSVEDNGIGIPDREVGRVFEPFYRAGAAVGRTSGAGLGLAVVHHVVKAHGGKIVVETKEGEGSRFSMLLPAAASGAGEAAPS